MSNGRKNAMAASRACNKVSVRDGLGVGMVHAEKEVEASKLRVGTECMQHPLCSTSLTYKQINDLR
ncbi:hypothetical protein EMIT0194MI4_10042 [Pseudomonas sp. IT-194MI4]